LFLLFLFLFDILFCATPTNSSNIAKEKEKRGHTIFGTWFLFTYMLKLSFLPLFVCVFYCFHGLLLFIFHILKLFYLIHVLLVGWWFEVWFLYFNKQFTNVCLIVWCSLCRSPFHHFYIKLQQNNAIESIYPVSLRKFVTSGILKIWCEKYEICWQS